MKVIHQRADAGSWSHPPNLFAKNFLNLFRTSLTPLSFVCGRARGSRGMERGGRDDKGVFGCGGVCLLDPGIPESLG